MGACPACGASTDVGDRFCSACGQALAAPVRAGDEANGHGVDAGWRTPAAADLDDAALDEPELLVLEAPTAGRPTTPAADRRRPSPWMGLAGATAAVLVALGPEGERHELPRPAMSTIAGVFVANS